MSKPLPCPFCGGTNIQTAEGSTFRWVYAYCAECGAQSCEVRKATLTEDQAAAQSAAEARALEEWNTRVSDRSDEGADSATAKPERPPAFAPDGSWVRQPLPDPAKHGSLNGYMESFWTGRQMYEYGERCARAAMSQETRDEA